MCLAWKRDSRRPERHSSCLKTVYNPCLWAIRINTASFSILNLYNYFIQEKMSYTIKSHLSLKIWMTGFYLFYKVVTSQPITFTLLFHKVRSSLLFFFLWVKVIFKKLKIFRKCILYIFLFKFQNMLSWQRISPGVWNFSLPDLI